MDIFTGYDLPKHMKPGSKAVCVVGSYVNYEIRMDEHGDILYGNNKYVTLDRYFLNGKWQLINKKNMG